MRQPNERVKLTPNTVPIGCNLVFRSSTDANGTLYANLRFQVKDDGGTANGGVDLDPTPRLLTINVTPVNDPPNFVKGSDASATDESPAQSIPGWATGMSPGPPDEASQQLHFVVQSNTNTGLFAAGPAIDATGKLSFTPAPNVAGSAQIIVALVDDGGTANGGADTRPPQTFTISVAKAHPWHNAANRLDINSDGHIAPVDALTVINFINAFGSTKVPAGAGPNPPYYDVNADGSVAPNDALAIINQINAFGSSEGEASDAAATSGSQPLPGDLLALLALDIASQAKRRRG